MGSAVLQRMIQQLPAGGQVRQHALEAFAVGAADRPGRVKVGGGLALAERRQNAVLVGIDEAIVDALVLGLVILVVGIARRRLALIGLLQAEADRLLDRAERDGGVLVGDALHRLDAVLFQDPLHAADGVALAVQQAADALEQIDVVGAVIAPPAAALHRLDLGEPRLPKTQNVLWDIEIVSDLADGTERIRRLVQMPAPSIHLVRTRTRIRCFDLTAFFAANKSRQSVLTRLRHEPALLEIMRDQSSLPSPLVGA